MKTSLEILMRQVQSLQVLKVLSGRCWGRDWMVLLWLHCAVIFSETDYDSFMYGSTTKSKLSVIDFLHNTGICLAIRAFHTSHLECLYVESGGCLLSLFGNLLLWNYVVKLAKQPKHLTLAVVFYPTSCRTYMNSTCECTLQDLLKWNGIQLPHIILMTPKSYALAYYTFHTRSAIYQICKRYNIHSHVPPIFYRTAFQMSGPYSCV